LPLPLNAHGSPPGSTWRWLFSESAHQGDPFERPYFVKESHWNQNNTLLVVKAYLNNVEEQTNLFGIHVPSTDKTFLAFVVIHILIALVCVTSGLVAMLSDKNSKRHRDYGTIYFWAMLAAFLTIIILSVMRWPHNIHLLSIGTLSVIFSYAGRRMAASKRSNWTRLHTICMGASYILLLTGFYIDNGKNLPFWRLFPQWFFWIFPAMIGIPIILYVLKMHPLNRAK
jgi:uncharacterized membrane protein